MKNLFLFLCFFMIAFLANSQTTITGVITNPEGVKWVVLHQYYGINNTPLAKSEVAENGSFTIQQPSDSTTIEEGMYRLVYNIRENKYIDFIYSGQKNIHINFDTLNPLTSISFTNSQENTEYYKGFRSLITHENQLRVLNVFLQEYNKSKQQLYTLALQEYDNNVQAIDRIYTLASSQYSEIACTYLEAQKKYYPNPKDDFLLQNYYTQQHVWDFLNPTNTYILHSPIIADIIIGSVGQLRNQGASKQDYINAVDRALDWATPNEELTIAITFFLGEGFKMMDLPEIVAYIDVTYKANQCEADKDVDLQKRLEAYKRLAIGKQAPEIVWVDAANKPQLLSKQTATFYVVAFWASWCGNCEAILPSVNTYLKNRTDVLAIAVGLDENDSDWNHANQHYTNFIHLQAKEKWQNQTVLDYAIYATPTFYVLDKDKKIIGKAKNLAALRKLF